MALRSPSLFHLTRSTLRSIPRQGIHHRSHLRPISSPLRPAQTPQSRYTPHPLPTIPRHRTQIRHLSAVGSSGAGPPNLASAKLTSCGSLRVLRSLARYLWSHDQSMVKRRILIAVLLLAASKALSVTIPFLFKHAVDAIAMSSAPGAAVVLPTAALVGYGAVRAGASLAGELRNVVFAAVARKATVDVTVSTLKHLHELPLQFHLSREPDALARVIYRGQKGIDFMLRSMVSNVAPTLLEVSIVCAILATRFGPAFAGVTAGTVAYVAFTFGTTS